MADCFISFSSHDAKLADFVSKELASHGVSVFMASASLEPGQHWTNEILDNLRNSNWVIVMASKAACNSAYVNQEIGGALISSKNLIPIVWDMNPQELPGWLQDFQALDIRDSTVLELKQQIGAIADRIKQKKAVGWLIVGALVLALFTLGGSNK